MKVVKFYASGHASGSSSVYLCGLHLIYLVVYAAICPSIHLAIHLSIYRSFHPSASNLLMPSQSDLFRTSPKLLSAEKQTLPHRDINGNTVTTKPIRPTIYFITAEALLHAADFYFGSATVRATPSEKTNATTLRKWMVPSMPHRQQPRERNKQGRKQ